MIRIHKTIWFAVLVVASSSISPSTARADDVVVLEPLPLEGVMQAMYGTESTHAAIQGYIEACMSDRGFAYSWAPLPATSVSPIDLRSRYGPIDLPTVTSLGYADPDRMGDSGSERSAPDPMAGLSPTGREAWTKALLGEPDTNSGGCGKKAEHAVYGDRRQRSALVRQLEQLVNTAVKQMLDSRAAREATADWVRCMKEAGYNFEATKEARSVPYKDKAVEIQVAVADVRCTLETRFVQRLNASEVKAQLRLMNQRNGLLLAFGEQREKEDRRAARISAELSS